MYRYDENCSRTRGINETEKDCKRAFAFLLPTTDTTNSLDLSIVCGTAKTIIIARNITIFVEFYWNKINKSLPRIGAPR